MKLLTIECSTEQAQIALGEGDRYLVNQIEGPREHARTLLTVVESLLAEADWNLSGLDGVVFGRGPGSFTGLRVACAAAQGLAFARDLPVYPVSTLASIASQAREQYPNHSVLALMDARIQQWYWSLIPSGQYCAQEFVDDPTAIRVTKKNIIVAGRDIHAYNSFFHASLVKKTQHWLDQGPSAIAMMRMVEQNLIVPIKAIDAHPVYIRDKVT